MQALTTIKKPSIKRAILDILSHYKGRDISIRQLRRRVEETLDKWITEETIARRVRELRQEGYISYKPLRKGVYMIEEVVS